MHFSVILVICKRRLSYSSSSPTVPEPFPFFGSLVASDHRPPPPLFSESGVTMPTVSVGRDRLFEALGCTYSEFLSLYIYLLLRMKVLYVVRLKKLCFIWIFSWWRIRWIVLSVWYWARRYSKQYWTSHYSHIEEMLFSLFCMLCLIETQCCMELVIW